MKKLNRRLNFFYRLTLLAILNMVCLSNCAMQTPALQKHEGLEREDLITSYFNQGLTNAEIVGFLVLRHGIVCSVRTLKRILKRLGLKRARHNNESLTEHIVGAVLEELENSCGSFMGYRQLTRRLRRKYDLKVRRDTVMRALRIIDPEGVERRQKRALKRRRYSTPGPNFLWHVDGWDKLSPFGIFIHGAVDGFSRRILWLEVNSTNKNPNVIASHYLTTVQELEGVPRRMRCDRGTENTIIGSLQQFFRWSDVDDFGGRESFLEGKSCGNQRIEAWWSKFREGGGGWWMNLFKDLRDTGFYKDDYLTKECLKFCFIPIIRRELRLVAELWNTHHIQRQRRCDVEGGKPDVMFFTPQVYGKQDYLVNVDKDDVSACKEIYAENCVDYNEDMEELVRLIKTDYQPPLNEYEALKLYSEIIVLLKNH